MPYRRPVVRAHALLKSSRLLREMSRPLPARRLTWSHRRAHTTRSSRLNEMVPGNRGRPDSFSFVFSDDPSWALKNQQQEYLPKKLLTDYLEDFFNVRGLGIAVFVNEDGFLEVLVWGPRATEYVDAIEQVLTRFERRMFRQPHTGSPGGKFHWRSDDEFYDIFET